ncbi:MAPEG family protein [Paraglaciecola sp. L3A3]|uniref:MAPEG family protein n=1 Tax=Paraglaciecola sp. L3A3 TaxID=2686358 RepID=UPI00131D154E|nr:MAPEG family protein [Paraglaciecola sp. L3A3]
MNATILALLGYIGLIIVLLIWLVTYRSILVTKKTKVANGFKSDGSDVSPFGQRLTRAQANAVESFPFIGGLLLLALVANSSVITDSLAFWILGARLGQVAVHLVSTSVIAVQIRFVFFLVQIAIAIYWLGLLAYKFI